MQSCRFFLHYRDSLEGAFSHRPSCPQAATARCCDIRACGAGCLRYARVPMETSLTALASLTTQGVLTPVQIYFPGLLHCEVLSRGCGALYTSNLVAERATLCCRRHHGLSLPWWFYGQRVRECTGPACGCVERVSLGSTSTILCLDDAGSSTPVQYPRHCGSCWFPPPLLRVKVCGL